ncbi:MAG: hypothetical protein ACT4PE_09755 [Candidatus Eiseniibacteriota bacterium]
MKRIVTRCAFATAAMAFAVGASATPIVNSVAITPRIFNDCPTSSFSSVNNYPMMVQTTDSNLSCGGFANLHVWKFSDDGATNLLFANSSEFRFAVDLVISGATEGEAGINIAPWWFVGDGRINCRTTDGEVAVFGGRMPFYSFTANHGVVYAKGTSIHLEMIYHPNGLSSSSPGTVEYVVTYGSNTYSSGALALDMGNPAEDPPYGLWGILNSATVGGFHQPFLQGGNPNASSTATFTNIEYECLNPVSVETRSWGQTKAGYK